MLLALGVRQDKETLVCAQPDGSPLSLRALSKAFASLVAGMKLPIRLHHLRHSHLSHLLAAGVHPKVASERAGHASVSIALDVYSHLIPGMQEDAARRIDAALRTHLER
jgi:integrase